VDLVRLAATVWTALMMTEHGSVPEQPWALHPVKDESFVGEAVNVTMVPLRDNVSSELAGSSAKRSPSISGKCHAQIARVSQSNPADSNNA
jgi:hypothetical protein